MRHPRFRSRCSRHPRARIVSAEIRHFAATLIFPKVRLLHRHRISIAWFFRDRAGEPADCTPKGHGSQRFGPHLVGATSYVACPEHSDGSPRSWHISISLAYLPAWIIVSLVWHFRIFTGTGVALILFLHLILGLLLASWSFFVAAPFGKSPQLAAVASTFLSILFAILALTWKHASTGAAVIYSLIFPPGFYVFVMRAIAGYENNQIPTSAMQPDPDNDLRILPLLIVAVVSLAIYNVSASLN